MGMLLRRYHKKTTEKAEEKPKSNRRTTKKVGDNHESKRVKTADQHDAK